LDIFATVETWHDSFESPSVVAATPSGYQVFERARPRVGRQATTLKTNHCGICVFIKRDLQVGVIDLSLYKSFELLSLHVRFGHLSFVFIVIYRPPTSPPNETFFVDIADVLERPVSFAGCVVVGDINVHMDDASSTHTVRLVTLFDNFGLRDFVRCPTRKNPDHQLDVFFTRSNWPAPIIRVDPPLISDHSFIVAHLSEVTTGPFSNLSTRRRQWRSFVFDAFVEDLKQSRLVIDPPSDVTELFDCYDATVIELLDKHAPWRSIKTRVRQS